jgi:hypothetical protein
MLSTTRERYMPVGPEPIGFAYFAAVKAAGYTAASVILKNGYGLRGSSKPNVWSAGLTRTGIGIAAGLLYGSLWIFLLGKFVGDSYGGLYYIFLLPVRVAEWCLLIWIFFDRGLHDRARMWKYIAFGTLCSYALDAIGVGAALVLPGGIWVC